MVDWHVARSRLRDLLSQAEASESAVIPDDIDALAIEQRSIPITTNDECAAAVALGLASMGIELRDDLPGGAILRMALRYLSSDRRAETTDSPLRLYSGKP